MPAEHSKPPQTKIRLPFEIVPGETSVKIHPYQLIRVFFESKTASSLCKCEKQSQTSTNLIAGQEITLRKEQKLNYYIRSHYSFYPYKEIYRVAG